jgi:hypothetical protein
MKRHRHIMPDVFQGREDAVPFRLCSKIKIQEPRQRRPPTEKAPGLGSSRKGLSGKVAFSGPEFAISLSEKWLFEARNRRPLSWTVAFSDEILRFFLQAGTI